MALSEEVLQLLACPVCRGGMSEVHGYLVCPACKLKFPILDGIPVLLLDAAKEA
jgi:uncharacterized protein